MKILLLASFAEINLDHNILSCQRHMLNAKDEPQMNLIYFFFHLRHYIALSLSFPFSWIRIRPSPSLQ